jgi:phosphoribosylglycinamide formyltransferase 1
VGGPLRVAVLASGRGSNLLSLLRHVAAGHVDARVTLVASDRPDAGALEIARKARVPAVVSLPPEPGEKAAAYDVRLAEILAAERPDLVVLAGYLRIVGPALLTPFAGRIVNIHPSLLPSFQGLKAVRQALAKGVGVAGCTTHVVTSDLDGGPILLQAALAVRPGDDEGSLSRRILALEHLLLPRTVQLFAEGRVAVADGRARIAAGPSWLGRAGIEFVSGALYSEGF